jgi:hypothetical protein
MAKKKSNPVDADERIENLKCELGRLVTDWRQNAHSPPNFVRQNGTGTVTAIVDRWCGGYQDVHYPAMIGWKVERDNRSCGAWSGIVIVNDAVPYGRTKNCNLDQEAILGMISDAITKAKAEADKAFEEAMEGIVPGFTFSQVENPDPLLQQVKDLLSGVSNDLNWEFDVQEAEARQDDPHTVAGVRISSSFTSPLWIWKVKSGRYFLENEDGGELFAHMILKEVVAKAVSTALADYATSRITSR